MRDMVRDIHKRKRAEAGLPDENGRVEIDADGIIRPTIYRQQLHAHADSLHAAAKIAKTDAGDLSALTAAEIVHLPLSAYAVVEYQTRQLHTFFTTLQRQYPDMLRALLAQNIVQQAIQKTSAIMFQVSRHAGGGTGGFRSTANPYKPAGKTPVMFSLDDEIDLHGYRPEALERDAVELRLTLWGARTLYGALATKEYSDAAHTLNGLYTLLHLPLILPKSGTDERCELYEDSIPEYGGIKITVSVGALTIKSKPGYPPGVVVPFSVGVEIAGLTADRWTPARAVNVFDRLHAAAARIQRPADDNLTALFRTIDDARAIGAIVEGIDALTVEQAREVLPARLGYPLPASWPYLIIDGKPAPPASVVESAPALPGIQYMNPAGDGWGQVFYALSARVESAPADIDKRAIIEWRDFFAWCKKKGPHVFRAMMTLLRYAYEHATTDDERQYYQLRDVLLTDLMRYGGYGIRPDGTSKRIEVASVVAFSQALEVLFTAPEISAAVTETVIDEYSNKPRRGTKMRTFRVVERSLRAGLSDISFTEYSGHGKAIYRFSCAVMAGLTIDVLRGCWGSYIPDAIFRIPTKDGGAFHLSCILTEEANRRKTDGDITIGFDLARQASPADAMGGNTPWHVAQYLTRKMAVVAQAGVIAPGYKIDRRQQEITYQQPGLPSTIYKQNKIKRERQKRAIRRNKRGKRKR